MNFSRIVEEVWVGKNTAFTMSQRYVSSEALVAAEKTSDLA